MLLVPGLVAQDVGSQSFLLQWKFIVPFFFFFTNNCRLCCVQSSLCECIHKELGFSFSWRAVLVVISFCLSSRNAKDTARKEVAADKIAVFDLLRHI